MSTHFELVDINTMGLVGDFDNLDDVFAVLDYNLEQNGAHVILEFELLVGNETGPISSIDGEELLKIAQGRSYQSLKVRCEPDTPGIEFAMRSVALSFPGIGINWDVFNSLGRSIISGPSSLPSLKIRDAKILV